MHRNPGYFLSPLSCRVFCGPSFRNILCWKHIYWLSGLLRTVSYHLLVVFVVTHCWDPLSNIEFQSGSRGRRPPCARRQPAVLQLECGTWFHHSRRLQCVLSRNLRIFKVAMWHYRSRHNLKNNYIWDNLQCCLLVPRSPSKPVMLTFDCKLEKCYSLRSFFGMYNLEWQLWYWHSLTRHCPCNLLPGQPLLNMNIERNFEATLWRNR